MVAFLSLMGKVNCDYARGCIDSANKFTYEIKECAVGQPVYKACSNDNLENQECDKPICWETYVGQQLYRLTLIDFLVQVS